MRRWVPVLVLPWLLLVAGPLTAQGNIDLTLNSTLIGFPTPGITDFDTGWVDHPGLVVSIKSRPKKESWELRIRADSPDLGGYGKPAEDVLWRVDGSPWRPLRASGDAVLQGQGDGDVTVYFRLRLDWAADLPGDYAVDVIFSASRV